MALSDWQLHRFFGVFTWEDDPHRRGAIIVAPKWIAENLTRIEPTIPLLTPGGKPIRHITCHKRIASHLLAVFEDLRANNPESLIHTWDGCWVPRHMLWNPAKPLSAHSWGIAFDLNASRFPYGHRLQQDPGMVNAFARFGFEWGGNWRVPDAMHFEAVKILPAPPACHSEGERSPKAADDRGNLASCHPSPPAAPAPQKGRSK